MRSIAKLMQDWQFTGPDGKTILVELPHTWNAKDGQDGGTITLTLQKTDRHARLIVTNPGEPIPPEQLKRLFERFYRADASRGEKSGFGLGLPIADTIAAEHKGTLKAESDAASTRFLFTVPLKK